MKKVVHIIITIFLWFVLTIAAVIFGVYLLVVLPFDYIKYKRSLYYRTERRKYEPYVTNATNFKIYNEILANQLPIQFIYNPSNPSLILGWFVYRKTLIVPSEFPFAYDAETEQWSYFMEEVDEDGFEKRKVFSLDAYIQMQIEEANGHAGYVICDKAILLIDANDMENAEFATGDDRILIYTDNRAEVLKEFCSRNRDEDN